MYIRSSPIILGWRTPRYCPTRRGPLHWLLRRGAAYFHAHGITKIERVTTDDVCELDARQVFIKPHCPWQNGKVERPNRTLQTE
jgi:transposase InsO family protein